MRRLLSILVIVVLGLPTLTLMLTGDEDARLPACCRRHGIHHCAMVGAPGTTPGTAPVFQAPVRCPHYPSGPKATFVRAFALTPASVASAIQGRTHALVPDLPHHPRFASLRTQADRGPPVRLAA